MNTHADKAQADNSRSVANTTTAAQSSSEPVYIPQDNRPEAIIQKNLQLMADNSGQVKQLRSYQQMANNSPQATSFSRLQTMAQNAPQKPVLQNKSMVNAVIQRVTDDEAGAYMGYTLGDAEPSLYFAKGHLTQVHLDPNNVGWHPNKGNRHFIQNINAATHKHYDENRAKLTREQKTKFGAEVEGGAHTEKDDKGLMMEGDVVINPKDKTETFYLHPSRGRFIRTTDPAFKPAYNAAYAKAKVNAGQLAKNEQP